MSKSFTFTAVNAKQLSKQLDEAEAIQPRLCMNFGRHDDTWWAHGADGRNPCQGLTFRDLVSLAQKRFDEAQESAEFAERAEKLED